MGQEIATTQFTSVDFEHFHDKLKAETGRLHNMLSEQRFSDKRVLAGLELEAWLLNKTMRPAPINHFFLEQLHDPMVNAELARFNIEFNTEPHPLQNQALTQLHQQLQSHWSNATQQAQKLDCELMMIGILPTLQQYDLSLLNMSPLNRYRALNEQILSARGKPVRLDITGNEHLKLEHYDVMLESAATSLQLHTQVPIASAHHYYNASILASAPMVAICANAPYLFGKDLWQESRIPLFEQAIESGGYNGAAAGPLKRVSFGTGFANHNIFECFNENLEHFPILLPVDLGPESEDLKHLRLHNGTIWRWNRPLIGFSADGTPHIRIEHRSPSAGPTIIDTIANAAFYFGLSNYLYDMLQHNPSPLSFAEAKDNFYQAARYGLDSHVTWFDGCHHRLHTLLEKELIPMAYRGLQSLQIDDKDAEKYLSIISQRVETQQTGSHWQRKFIAKYGHDYTRMTQFYLYHQQQSLPVSTWTL